MLVVLEAHHHRLGLGDEEDDHVVPRTVSGSGGHEDPAILCYGPGDAGVFRGPDERVIRVRREGGRVRIHGQPSNPSPELRRAIASAVRWVREGR